VSAPRRSAGGEPPARETGEGALGPHELRLDLPAVHSAGRMGRQVLRRFAEREGVPPAEIQTLEFIAGELLSNAVDHGGGRAAMDEADLEGDVRMTLVFSAREGGWELRVGDQGGGDPRALERLLGADDAPDLEDERGRGLFLMRRMVDRLSVAKSEDGLGLVFVATKRYGRAG
jgi:anti-sigma regulatory factor (Ser/Thr protein kinase)